MADEFDTVPGWTAEAVERLGAAFAVPAACRGSGGPAALDWLLHHLDFSRGAPLLDLGAGMGGPAAYAARTASAAAVLVEPMTTACQVASSLFGLPAVVADGARLPFADGSFATAWSLGVLCTVGDKPAHLAEAARVLKPDGALGLLVYERTVEELDEQPAGNEFPTSLELSDLLAQTGLTVQASARLDELPPPPPSWQEAQECVDTWIASRHGHEGAWREARQQQATLGSLIDRGLVAGHLVVARSSTHLPRTTGKPVTT